MDNSVVSVALMRRGEVILGVVRHPYLDLTFWAYKGRGAFLNGKPIHVSDRSIEHAMLATAWSAYDKSKAPACFRIAEKLYSVCEDIRRTGTAAFELCLLAKGAVDIYFEINLSPWDYAAASRIVEEAGGHIRSLDGGVHLYGPGPVIAGNTADNTEYVLKAVEQEVGRH
jgi:myo-inositol-1(or 4)-monophosphatase